VSTMLQLTLRLLEAKYASVTSVPLSSVRTISILKGFAFSKLCPITVRVVPPLHILIYNVRYILNFI